jgi:glutathione synthase/RimK-type ligase-like ATP-grasp enzyme
VVQEFIDSSSGIHGLVDGVHDLRLYRIDGETVLGSVRTPAKGSLIANTNQGGTIAFFPVADLPEEALNIADIIDKKFEKYGSRYYSIDLIKGSKKWYVLEVNDRPGVPALYQSPDVDRFHNQLANCIVKAANNPLNKLENLL